MEKSCHYFSGFIKGVVLTHSIIKYHTVTANHNSDVILPTLEANLYKLKSKHRMKNVDIQHVNTQSTYRQLNKRLIEDTHMTNYHHPYYSLILSDFYLFSE